MGSGTRNGLTTTDFRAFERCGLMFLPDHNNLVLFPGRVRGRQVVLTRPMPATFNCAIHQRRPWVLASGLLEGIGAGHRGERIDHEVRHVSAASHAQVRYLRQIIPDLRPATQVGGSLVTQTARG